MAELPYGTDKPQRTIVIVGAGIGGLTAALALAAARFAVVVVEQSERLAEAGAGIQIAPNARRIIDRLGLGPAFAARAIEPTAIDIRNGLSGSLVTSVHGTGFTRRYAAPYAIIHRADLQAVLLDAIKQNPAIRLLTNADVKATNNTPRGIDVTVDSREAVETVAAEALIGADGVWSETRRLVRGVVRPEATGRTAWRALVPTAAAPGLAPNRVGLWLGPNAHLVHYPVSGGASLNLVAIVEDRWHEAGWNGAGDAGVLEQHFQPWCPDVRRLLTAAPTWKKHAIFSVGADGAWAAGRFAILGDAAHAMAPFLAQGAAMAIEDAAVLADALRTIDDVPTALSAYEAARRPRAEGVAATSARTGAQYHWQGLAALGRDTALRLMGERLIFDRYDWIYRWRAPGEQPVSA